MTNKWGQLLSKEIESLNKDKTIFILPLGMLDDSGVWTKPQDVVDEARRIADSINLPVGPLNEYQAAMLPALWFGSADFETDLESANIAKNVIEVVCLGYKQQGIKYMLLVVHDATDSAARTVAEHLNDGQPQSWISVFNPLTDKDPQAAGPAATACLIATALATGVPNPACLLIPF